MKQKFFLAAIASTMLLAACGRSLPGSIAQPAPPDAAVSDALPALSDASARADISSTQGSGAFGAWTVDRYGLPAYDYTLDEIADPLGARTDLKNRTEAWHQLGNDAIVANAYNHGYVELWSQQRLYQWVNQYVEADRHYAGGYGYVEADGQAISTLWLDRPAGSTPLRRFGVGYYEKQMQADGIDVREAVTSPFGDAPVLVHEITLTNTRGTARDFAWWEYWDVNPRIQFTTTVQRGLAAAQYDINAQTLSVQQSGDGADTTPLTIFLAAADAPVSGFETDLRTFFGNGDRAHPAAIAAGASNSIAPSSPSGRAGNTLFALRSPVTLAPGASVTLRYVYGMAHGADIAPLVAQVQQQASTQDASAQAWRNWLPDADLGPAHRWLARELQWDAYAVRSSSLYEETCGHHVITQGGYYQYGLGLQIAYRDPLQHMLPLIYSAPELARDVLRYSLQQQPPELGQISYGMGPLCTRTDSLGTADDLDFWLMLSVVDYVEGLRDFDFLDEQVGYRGGLPLPALTSGSVWDHLKLAWFHMETVQQKGPNGHYLIGSGGDWSDLSPVFLQMTESVLVSSQLAYMYPRLAELAEQHGDLAFAQQVRTRAAELNTKMQTEWTPGGWFSRGYAGTRQIGSGAIFGEPQPWAILADLPSAEQATTLVANIRRFLTGVGAPPEVKGPALIGSSQSPATADPDVTERSQPAIPGGNNAVFVGGVWYAVNGWLTWALGHLDGIVPHAADYALDELERNTLKAHATAWPEKWNGVLNVDDVCSAQFADTPDLCGIGIFVQQLNINGQITHQPAWSLYATLKLAGVEPTARGYRIAPHLPIDGWSLRLPQVGLAQSANALRGYVTAVTAGPVEFQVLPRNMPAGADWGASVNGHAVQSTVMDDGAVRFVVNAAAGERMDWVVRGD